MRRREPAGEVVLKADGKTGLADRNVMRKGVASPSKGNVILSVVLPRKICSAVGGAAGVGVNNAFVNGSFCRRCNTPRLLLVARLAVTASDMTIVSFAATVPFRKTISILKLG